MNHPKGEIHGDTQSTPASLCPRCQTTLGNAMIQDVKTRVETLHCQSCGGQFFPAGQLEPLARVHEPTLVEIRHIPSAQVQAQPLPCPVCPSSPTMDKAEHERDHQVVVDICPSCHGTWLDGGELEAIQQESLLVFLAENIRWFAGLFKK